MALSEAPPPNGEVGGPEDPGRRHRVAIRHMILGFVVLLALLFVVSLCTLPGR